jgi:nucleoside-diphosphate-sugar epimerase
VRVLVTGASGFLGRHVMPELLRRGHEARALVRSDGHALCPGVELAHGDLRARGTLTGIADGIDVVLHLATPTSGDPEDGFAAAVTGTENLFDALDGSTVRRVVLASSVVVYDWARARGTVAEDAPLVEDPWRREGYTAAKLWQERVAARRARQAGIGLTVLRPGFIWGPGRMAVPGTGQRIGPVEFVVTGRRRVPATYVENCAHCFVTAAEDERACGRVYNVVDGRGSSPWTLAGVGRHGSGRLPVPYPALRATALLAGAAAGRLFEFGGRLPGVLDPARSQARFKAVQWSAAKLERELGWRPPLTFHQAAARSRDG